ncbi:MAG: hypothetical protein Q9191_004126 [Dirinaria sp. TL-2023a]
MAASHIPNLNTFRAIRGGRPSRRGRSALTEEERAVSDKIIQGTDQDASVSRLSAVEVGYLSDPFARFFVPSENERRVRRYPIINRGTFVRTTAIDKLVEAFLSAESSVKKQIISLGAGSDTRFFRIHAKLPCPPNSYVYHELDFSRNTASKINTITSNTSVSRSIPGPVDISADGTTLRSPNYTIQPIDLRSLDSGKKSDQGISQPDVLTHFDVSLPTLLVSECCLVYLEPRAADAVLDYFAALFPPLSSSLGIIVYEPFNPFDSFGEVMVSNLAARGIVLQTLQKYHSLDVQKSRLRSHGFETAEAADVDFLWEDWIDGKEKDRVAGLEMVDEVEEWKLLARHYCVVWGYRSNEDKIWDKWRQIKGQ